MQQKYVLIGGHPKGYPEAFHQNTYSGRVLRKILKDLRDIRFFDVWNSEEEQEKGELQIQTKEELLTFLRQGYSLIALGRKVEKALLNQSIPHRYLPHPASRRKSDRNLLAQELKKLSEK